ncbi:hypothetical protein ACFT8P_33895 [Streptomyces sp. NPDC057101]|uniref:hypothetical protein n=1 Tax=Streptomyces sp. NPDC057101 TaxID=3346020 RepID=UPI003637FA4B
MSHDCTAAGAPAAYAHSLYSERDTDAMEVLLHSPWVLAALPGEHLCQLRMLHLPAKSPDRFEGASFDLSEEEREYLQRYPVLYEQIMIMLGL